MLVVCLPAPSEPVELSRKPVSQGRRVFTRSSTLGSVKTETQSEPVGQAVPTTLTLSLKHIRRCRRLLTSRSRWSPYH